MANPMLMRALDAHPGPGIALVGRVDRSMLGDEGMKLLLKAPRAVDRRYLRPADRVDLGRVVLGLARAGEAGTRDWQVCAALNNLGADCLFVGDLDGAHDAFEQSSECSRRLAREQPESERAKSDLSVALNGIGLALIAGGSAATPTAAHSATPGICVSTSSISFG